MDKIKLLKIRFIAVTMTIVTIMLLIIFGLMLSLTKRRIYSNSLKMMQGVADMPIGMNRNIRPEKRDRNSSQDVQLPFFRVEVDSDGNIVDTDGNFYDLTDEASINSLVSEVLSSDEKVGDLKDYSLRYMKVNSTPFREGDMNRNDGPKPESVPGEVSESSGTGIDKETPPAPDGDKKERVEVKNPGSEEAPAKDPDGNQDSDVKDDKRPEDPGKDKWDGKSNRLIVFADMSSEIATMHNLARNCIFSGFLSFFVLLAISIYFARWAVKPVEDAWKQQKQFVSDASHELKTPLTVILTDAEMLRSKDFDEAKKRQFADNIFTMSLQMRGLVESLLQLARVDNGAVQNVPHKIIDLSQLLANEILTFEVIFFEKGLMLTENIQKGISIKGSEQHIKQAVEILLDNAQKYSDSNGTVNVSLEKSGSHKCIISVSNPGAQISEENLKNIFKRFYRIDEARAMNHSYGLGLSIAQNIVNNHKGRIWAESKDGLNTFRIELPMA
ncbi:sensor histidine kinase [Oribacterium sp. WCC10]|uniref:sensor histidine kinase n=1 Tax=Oribacterium sp. WCC10 TaxID=1855343 RepID=UPI0008E6F628|nr:HAMP domain-containing sensor histidine kinase [Oribacterium sp. WCC10]SFG61838.1 Signal transduction histidine kinase [Oribacterium sp. WCC10]